MIHIDIFESTWAKKGYIKTIEILTNDKQEVIVKHPGNSITTMMIDVSNIDSNSKLELYTSLDNMNWFPYTIQTRTDSGNYIEDSCKPLQISFSQDGKYIYSFDSNLKFKYTKIKQIDSSAKYNIILITDTLW